MERGVVTERNYILRYLGSFWREGERYLMFEPVVTLKMAEKMRREAEADGGVEQGQVARVQKAMEPKTQGPSSQAEQKANLGRRST